MASKKVTSISYKDRNQSAKLDRRIDIDRRNLVRFEMLGSDRRVERSLENEELTVKLFSK